MAYPPPPVRFRIRDPTSLGLFPPLSFLARLTRKVRNALDKSYISTHKTTSLKYPLDGQSHASPVSQIPGSVSTSLSSPSTSQGDDVLTCVDSSRVEKRRLNTLAARRCRQRRVDRMKNLEDELESMRRERDELRLKVSKLEGETQALKGLLTRKSK